ncbi:hypothetical protein CLV35_1383 [Motilibacter peucedani]|uniref:Uncharacterized protein n=1 Tax=Motilibacter peucedani TaxID=598650 RepID=A0A420XSA3_9ACTN|nr:hypothetical protein [Motilibacter peucedani]RKS77689.1 hypothetical protein CLV35_1383 [Motilibacter peucedani]
MTPTDADLDAYIRTRLALLGIDISVLAPTGPADPATGSPSQEGLLASVRGLLTGTVPQISPWLPAATSPEYAQQQAVPALYPSILQAWSGKVHD